MKRHCKRCGLCGEAGTSHKCKRYMLCLPEPWPTCEKEHSLRSALDDRFYFKGEQTQKSRNLALYKLVLKYGRGITQSSMAYESTRAWADEGEESPFNNDGSLKRRHKEI